MENLLYFTHYLWSFIFIISCVVFVHEFGHYIVAKMSGIKIETFSIGFGKEILGWNDKSGTRWRISLVPLGGYVKMFGDKNAASVADENLVLSLNPQEKKQSFHTQPLTTKFSVILAGPVANFVLAIIILTFYASFYGIPSPSPDPVIAYIAPNSSAANSDLKINDRIISINQTKIHKFSDIGILLEQQHIAKPINITLERKNNLLSVNLTPQIQERYDYSGKKINIPVIGISPLIVSEKYTLIHSLAYSCRTVYEISSYVLFSIKEIITGKQSANELGGPIKIAQYSGQATKEGFKKTLWFIALLSINLGLMNLLPIPLLDGGHLMFYLIEGVTRRPLNKKIQEFALHIGLLFLLFMIFFSTYNDLRS